MEKNNCSWLIFYLLFQCQIFHACLLKNNTPDVSFIEVENNSSSTKVHQRQKRWVGLLIRISLETTDTALTVVNSLKGGCVYRPNICLYRDNIAKFEIQEQNLSRILNEKYESLLTNVEKFATSVFQNIEISRHIEDIVITGAHINFGMSILNSTIKLEEFKTNESVVMDFPDVSQNFIEKFYMERERSFKNLNIVQKASSLLHLVNRLTFKSVNRIISKISFALSSKSMLKEESFKSFYHKYTQEYLSQWKGKSGVFSGPVKLSETLRAKVRGFVKTASIYIRDSAKNFYKSKTFWGTTAVSLAGAVISQGLQAQRYIQIENEMKILMENHKTLILSLKTVEQNLTDSIQDIDEQWQISLDFFRNLTSYINDTKSSFEDIPAEHQSKLKHMPSLQTMIENNFENISSSNILMKQRIFLNYLTEMKESIKKLKAVILLELHLSLGTERELHHNREVNDIVAIINGKLDNEETMHQKVDKKRVICEIAKRHERNYYDYYNLNDFRPNCPNYLDMDVIEADRLKLKRIMTTLNSILMVCEMSHFNKCPSLSNISQILNLSEEETKRLIKSFMPHMLNVIKL
ncbi:uncharacterized protein LOC121303939 [Polyodon spathula]|uniref:uncharacterized protein LOC121303939 n=1 Tax=Polyodon spathula TaxID=7913 RepID=UPI001B7F689D|nr:uncharacterized protein LOC121303939 [Polyodon spathula]